MGAVQIASYETVADLPASIDPGADGKPVGSQARVYADPDDANNTYWIRTAASGTNNGWVIDVVYISQVAAVVQPLVDEAVAAAETAVAANAALYVNRFLFGAEAPVTGINAPTSTYTFVDTFAEEKTIVGIRVRGGSVGGNLKVKVSDGSGSLVTSRTVVTTANTLADILFDTPIVLAIGHSIGFYNAVAGAHLYNSATAWGTGVYAASGDASTGLLSGVLYTTIRLEVGLIETAQVVTAETFEAVEADVVALESLTEPRDTIIGRETTPTNSGIVTGGSTLTIGEAIPTDGRVTKIEIFGGTSGGSVLVRRFAVTDAGGGDTDYDQVGADYAVAVTANTLATVNPTDLYVKAGERLGFYAPTDSVRNSTGTDEDFTWFFAGGNVSSFTVDSSDTGSLSRLEVRFTVETLEIKQEVLAVADGAAATGSDRIVRDYRNEGESKVEIGFQNVDNQDPQAGFVRVHGGTANPGTFFEFSTYQYGGAIRGGGDLGHVVELQLKSDVKPTLNPEFSVRARDGGTFGDNLGSRIQTRNSSDHIGFGLNFLTDSDPHIWLEGNPDQPGEIPATIGIYHPLSTGAVVVKVGGVERMRTDANGLLVANSADPATPTGAGRIYVEDGALKFKGSSGTVTVLAPA